MPGVERETSMTDVSSAPFPYEVKEAYDGQQATLVRVSSSTCVATCLKASGQVRGPMLTTVSVLSPNQPCAHHVVTACGTQRKLWLTLMPYPGSQATSSESEA